MAKPIIYNLDAMNCEEENVISFTYSGGLIKSNAIRIKRASDNEIIYEGTYSSAKGIHVLPANSIDVSENGTEYYVQIKVTENDDTESVWSDIRYAMFITTPSFSFEDITNPMTVHQSFLDVSLGYQQAEGEPIQSYEFFLYDQSKSELYASDILYDVENMIHRYSGLEDNTYYIRAKGNTIHNYKVDTGYIEITVDYVIPIIYNTFYITNNYEGGYISYETNIVDIDYTGEDTFTFIDGRINLMDKSIYYEKGFIIPDNFTFIIKGKNLYRSGVKFFELYNTEKNTGFYITSYIYDDDQIRFKLISNNGLEDYILYSSPIELTENDLVDFWVRRINGIFDFKVYKNGEVV
ncbi:MAG: hypothetical protein J6Z11_16320 [Candidatus Riflebacteria bacterium]|nr:hypothetical protein [Candidatus Riflebacteria bacterium]